MSLADGLCHTCGTMTLIHDEAIHERRADTRLARLEDRIRAQRAALPADQTIELIRPITLTLPISPTEQATRRVFFRSWPGSGSWWSDPQFAVVYGSGEVVHLRAIHAEGDDVAPVVEIPLESGIRPYRELPPHLLGWADYGRAYPGFLISADPTDADPSFGERPSPIRERIVAAYREFFNLEREYAELRDELAPLLQRQGENLALRNYPLTERSGGADLYARELWISEALRARGESTQFPEIATESDLWHAAIRRGLVAGDETAIAARLAQRRWNHAGD